MNGVPLWKPPYGRVTAIDLNTGDHRWMTPVGDLADEVPALKQLGLKNSAGLHADICCSLSQFSSSAKKAARSAKEAPLGVPKFQIVTPNLIAIDKVLENASVK